MNQVTELIDNITDGNNQTWYHFRILASIPEACIYLIRKINDEMSHIVHINDDTALSNTIMDVHTLLDRKYNSNLDIFRWLCYHCTVNNTSGFYFSIPLIKKHEKQKYVNLALLLMYLTMQIPLWAIGAILVAL